MSETSFRFAHPEFLYALFGVLLLAALFIVHVLRIRKNLRQLADSVYLSVLIPDYSATRKYIRFVLYCVAYVSLVVAIARPQFGIKQETVTKRGVEVVLALDVSNSMLAEDVKPNRIERAKLSIQKMLTDLQQDKVGLVIFAGDSYIQLPLTTDMYAAKMIVQTLHTGLVSKQGTAIGAAIRKSIRCFSDDPKTAKAIVLISDGENHEDDALQEVQRAKEKGIVVYTIGMGGALGVPIPITNRNGQTSFLQDKSGRPVTTKLHEEMLQTIAREGDGVYSRVDFAPIVRAMCDLEKTDFESRQYGSFDEKYHYFIVIALLCMCLEFMLLERKNKWLKQINIFTINNK